MDFEMRNYQWTGDQHSELVPKMVADETVEGKMSDNLTYTTLEPAAGKGMGRLGVSKKHILDMEDDNTNNWSSIFPRNWTSKEVVEWYYDTATRLGEDIQSRRGDKFNMLTGVELTNMTREEFEELDPSFGSKLYSIFNRLKRSPEPINCYEAMSTDSTFNYDRDYSDGNTSFLPSAMCMDVPVGEWSDSADDLCEEPINNASLLIAGFDYDFNKNDQLFEYVPDEGYHSSSSPPPSSSPKPDAYASQWSDASSDDSNPPESPMWAHHNVEQQRKTVLVPPFESRSESAATVIRNSPALQPAVIMQNTMATPAASVAKSGKRPPGRPRKYPLVDRPKGTRGRKPGQKTKGNHLWEFVRDLLLDPQSNPRLVKWLNHSEGIFCFVQSDTVAKMWGEKKKNSNMTYEKMSRAMRYCRGNDDFAEIPKDGSYPKKLCFKFGPNATGWQKKSEPRPAALPHLSSLVSMPMTSVASTSMPVTSMPQTLPSVASFHPDHYQLNLWHHNNEKVHLPYSQYTIPHEGL